MNAKLVFEHAHCVVTQLNDHTISLKLKGFLKAEHLVEISRFTETFIKNNSIVAIMVDQTDLKVLSKDVIEQMTKLVHATAENGIQKIAIVDAEDIFAKASINKLQKEAPFHPSVTRAHFLHERGALEWLSHS
jgi:anti-anti-sigma regulatory factor